MKTKLVNSQLSNFNTFDMYKREMLALAENVFNFENLPPFIDVSYLNKTLLRKGAIAFFKDDILGVLALPFVNISSLDVYGRPVRIEVYGQNGYTKTLNKDEFVIMYDNNGRYPLYIDIIQMAERIGMKKRVIDINIAQQKTARIWKTTDEKERTVRDLLNQIDGNVETVLTYDNIDLNDIDSVLAPAPFVSDKIEENLKEDWAEFFRLIGIANIQLNKKERLITDEMQASEGGTIASRFNRFNPRYKAIKEINAKWGLDIKVAYYDGLPTSLKPLVENIESEVDTNANDANVENDRLATDTI